MGFKLLVVGRLIYQIAIFSFDNTNVISYVAENKYKLFFDWGYFKNKKIHN